MPFAVTPVVAAESDADAPDVAGPDAAFPLAAGPAAGCIRMYGRPDRDWRALGGPLRPVVANAEVGGTGR